MRPTDRLTVLVWVMHCLARDRAVTNNIQWG